MLISIFTPTHNSTHLLETYHSLFQQDARWEWVLVLNGEGYVPDLIRQDERVRVIPYPSSWELMYGRNIGALKKFACEACKGELLVELDHDDFLTPDALKKLRHYKELYPHAGFFYSDCVGFWEDNRSEVFSEDFGWESYPFLYKGKYYTAMGNFPMTARSLCEIYYCPNHVRAWSREAYFLANGHNPSMKVIDDHDLLIRTYLLGVECVHIPEVLYFYRRHFDGATIQDGPLIQQQQTEVRDKYLGRLIKEWSRREGLLLYDLGGIHNTEEDFLTIDQDGTPDLKVDVTSPEFHSQDMIVNNSVGCFRAYDFLEHIPQGQHVVNLMNSLYEKLAPGGWLCTSTPSADGRGAFSDPYHQSLWSELSFRYYADRNYAKYANGRIKTRFQIVKLGTVCPSQWHADNRLSYVVCDMSALKGQRQPGLQLI